MARQRLGRGEWAQPGEWRRYCVARLCCYAGRRDAAGADHYAERGATACRRASQHSRERRHACRGEADPVRAGWAHVTGRCAAERCGDQQRLGAAHAPYNSIQYRSILFNRALGEASAHYQRAGARLTGSRGRGILEYRREAGFGAARGCPTHRIPPSPPQPYLKRQRLSHVSCRLLSTLPAVRWRSLFVASHARSPARVARSISRPHSSPSKGDTAANSSRTRPSARCAPLPLSCRRTESLSHEHECEHH